MSVYNSQITRSDASPLVPEDVQREIIKNVSGSSVVLSQARRLPNMPTNQRRMPILSALPTAYFVSGDTGLKQTTESAWANKYIGRDPYDLKELRRVQERKEYEDLELVAPEDADTVVCPHCLQPYAAQLKVCPHCGAH